MKQEQVFLVKIDVQGYEPFTIKGAHEMLSTKPPYFILMEYSPARYRELGLNPSQVLRDLIGYGYIIKTFEGIEVTATGGVIKELAMSSKEYNLELRYKSVS